MSRYDGFKNPEWTDGEFEFWRDHMRDYGDLWWFHDPYCGHARTKAKYDGQSGDFIIWCAKGHETRMPVLHSQPQMIDEGTSLLSKTEFD